jgi:2-haloacid dehalogenase
MTIHRRHLLLGAAAITLGANRAGHADGPARHKAIAFDGFVLIDPRPLAVRAEALFPGQGAALMEAWRRRQFEYTWLRTLSRRYADFWQVTQEALTVAGAALKLDMPSEARDRLMQTFLELKTWPDVAPALRDLKARGVRMAFLANPTLRMLQAPIENSALDGLLEEPLSTDRVQAYKPDPRAYQMGLDAFGLARERSVRRIGVMGCGWRQGVRLSILLGQPYESADRGAGRRPGRDRVRHGRSCEIRHRLD